ncbi:MAG: hypothetical protein WB795_20030 [Candidatus Acidiferrales bacterium]
MSTAVALTASSIRAIEKEKALHMLRKNKTSDSMVAYLLSSVNLTRRLFGGMVRRIAALPSPAG